jgi:hypothetical protein
LVLGRNSVDFFGLEGSASIAKTGLNVFNGKTWVIAQNFVVTPALGKKIDDEFNC